MRIPINYINFQKFKFIFIRHQQWHADVSRQLNTNEICFEHVYETGTMYPNKKIKIVIFP